MKLLTGIIAIFILMGSLATAYAENGLVPAGNKTGNYGQADPGVSDVDGRVVSQSHQSSAPIIHMSDTTLGTGQTINAERPIHAEFVSPTSQLVGDSIDTIIVQLRNGGSPTGFAEIGVFNEDLSVKRLFSIKDVSALTDTYADYTFSLPSGLTYKIESGDRIGVKYSGGDSSDFVAIMRDLDPEDPFDGANSYHTYYTTGWFSFVERDLYMILQDNSGIAHPEDATEDVFGILKLYPSKASGNAWYMDMLNPASDPRFDPKSAITKNPDGSWNIQQSQVRMDVYSTDEETYDNFPIPTLSRTQLDNKGYMQLPSDWKNIEMTGYIKLNAGNNDEFTWYGRGGSHSSEDPSGCEGSSYKANLNFLGNTRFAKESWHVNYDLTDLTHSTPPLLAKWIGFKYVIYDQPGVAFAKKVHHEIWVDVDQSNNWVKTNSFDDDGFGSGANHCGPAIADNMPITWGGPKAAFRVDDANNFDFKYLSVREIQGIAASACESLPSNGVWTIFSDCILESDFTSPASVVVQGGAVLTIPNGLTLTIPSGSSITVKAGSGVLIWPGGALVVRE